MLNEFKLGTNFDLKILEEIIKLNEEFKDKNVKVTEMYGSDRKHSALAARPGFRLPDVSFNDIKVYVKKAKEAGINFNYTMNSIIPYGSKQELVKHAPEIINFALKLEEIGVARVTVANPMLLELFKGKFKTMKIECSTIMHVDTPTFAIIENGKIKKVLKGVGRVYIDEKRGTLKLPDLNPADFKTKMFPDGVFHLYDYKFFYRNLQQNVIKRTYQYLLQHNI